MLSIRRFISHKATRQTALRCMSSQSYKDLNIDLDAHSKVAVVTLQKKPVNSLSLETLTEIRTALDELHANKNCEGLILTSSVPRIFCAGLDILEMYKPDQDRLVTFWSALQDVWIKLSSSRLATVAAINGNSPAGGCLLALTCDYRIMAQGKYSIGLNETKLGIVAPFWFQQTMIDVAGHRETERALMLGHMYSTQEALDKGIIDKIVPEAEVLSAAKEEIQQWLQIPAMARNLTKQQLRGDRVQKLVQLKETDIQNFINFTNNPGVQSGLGMYMESLKKRAQKSG